MFNMNELSDGLNKTWDSVTRGWHQLMDRAGNALTQFTEHSGDRDKSPVSSPKWGLMSADLFDEHDKLVVTLEVPGLDTNDFEISVTDSVLMIRGEKRFERESDEGNYHLLERAYGHFTRSIPLSYEVDADKAQASYKQGILRIELMKKPQQKRRHISVH